MNVVGLASLSCVMKGIRTKVTTVALLESVHLPLKNGGTTHSMPVPSRPAIESFIAPFICKLHN